MAISLSIQSIKFSGGDTLELPGDGVTVVVGPNNSGKTSLLREIQRFIKLDRVGPVSAKIMLNKHGNANELNDWLEKNVVVETDASGDQEYCWFTAKCPVRSTPRLWDQSEHLQLAGILCAFLSIDERFAYLESTKDSGYIERFNALTDAPPTPLHALQANDEIEKRASRFFRKEFGIDLILNRGLGTVLALHCG